MGSIYRSRYHDLCSEQIAHRFPKSIAPVRDWEQFERIVWPDPAPAASDGLRRRAGGQRAFEFIRSD
jgi:hypothetical protein